MFPFRSGELSFGISNDVVENTNTFTNNTCTSTPNPFLQPHLNDNSTSNYLVIESPKTKRGRSKAITNKAKNNANLDNNNKISGNDVDTKRITHREVERQRRQDMANLYSSLRSLLPVEYIRGKRSVCDHVTEAAKYITELEKNLKELGEKRDNLKNSIPSSEHQQPSISRDKLKESLPSSEPLINRDRDLGCSSSSVSSSSSSSSSSSTSEYNVSIHKFSKRLQIEIAAGSRVGDNDRVPLSKALKVLANEGLDVVSCVSSKVNQRWMCVIYCEVDDVTSFDSSHLQEKMMSVVSSCET